MTLKLKTSRKIFELIGFKESRKVWLFSKKIAERKCSGKAHPVEDHKLYSFTCPDSQLLQDVNAKLNPVELIEEGKVFPAYSFPELLRVMPAIGEAKKWGIVKLEDVVNVLVATWMFAATTNAAMEEIDEQLQKELC